MLELANIMSIVKHLLQTQEAVGPWKARVLLASWSLGL